MNNVTQPEVWLRGPLDGVDPLLMPVAHALEQAREDVRGLAESVPAEHVWTRPGGAASVGFHVRHLGGALDRLFTYARGATLNDAQKAAFRAEGVPGDPPQTLGAVVQEVEAIIDRAMVQVRATSRDDLLVARPVGRTPLPSTTIGLLFHAAEHSTRHAGQAVTTAKIVMAGS